MGAEPARVMAAAGEIPGAGQPEPAGNDGQFGRPDRAPGDNAVRRSENLSRDFPIEKGGNHRATVRLLDIPAGADVKDGDLLNQLDVGNRVSSAPPRERGCNRRNSPLSISAETIDAGSLRFRSISSAALTRAGASERARSR